MAFLNIRLWFGEAVGVGENREMLFDKLEAASRSVNSSCKFNFAFGAVLEHKLDGRLRYYHTSPNHNAELAVPALVRDIDDLRRLFDEVDHLTFAERAERNRPSTKWRVRAVTNLTFFIYPIVGAGVVGDPPADMPMHLQRNKA